MDSSVDSQDEAIRKIEDIIDIQKAKGNFNHRQVVFNLPSESDSTVSTNLAKSLESGLSETTKLATYKKSLKNLKSRHHKSSLPEAISWPSESDITVLRMKLCLTSSDLKENVNSIILGDGLHQPDSSSMVNLATLILQSRHESKHSVVEELLLPLTSWEPGQSDNKEPPPEGKGEEQPPEVYPKVVHNEFKRHEAICSHKKVYNDLSSPDSGMFSCKRDTKSKVARFLRLYFCPCCTCLYNLERMRDEQSICFTKRKEATII